MDIKEAANSGLINYTNFSGRATRSEFWWFIAFTFLVDVVSSILDSILGIGFISSLTFLGLLVPSISVTVRRLHDVGKSGWFLLVPVYNLYLYCQPSIAAEDGQ